MSQYSYSYESEISERSWRSFYMKTYGKMALGLLVTTAVAFFGFMDLVTNYNNSFIFKLMSGFGPMMILIAQLGICMYLSFGLQKMSPMAAKLAFFGYCAITGVTLSTIPLAFNIATIYRAILFTAVLFISLLIIGMTTKVDISRFSGILMAGLITLLIMSIFSFFVNGSLFATFYDYLGVFIFMGLTAWDAQNLKKYYVYSTADSRLVSNYATYAAFGLFLDFINLFLRVLSIFGRSDTD